MRKLFLTCIKLLILQTAFTQQITFEPIEAGPYGNNSSIAVLFKPSGVFPSNNVFELYLSDPTGTSFPAIPIGTYRRHYTTFINGIIPNNTAPSNNYKLKIVAKSGTNIVAQTTSPYSITINSSQGQAGNFISVQGWDPFRPNSTTEL
jgi:hypothetical protein